MRSFLGGLSLKKKTIFCIFSISTACHGTADDNSGNCHLYQSLNKNTPVTATPDYQNVQTLFAESDYQNVQTLEGGLPGASVHILGSQTESAYEPLKGPERQNLYEPLNERSN